MRANTREAILERVVVLDNGCVEWPAPSMKTGYACVGYQRKVWLVHRLFYEWYAGPIPMGMDIHHRCFNKRCVNLEHLQVVTRKEHVHLDDTFAHLNSLKTHCPKGHPYEGDNLVQGSSRPGPHRKCRVCMLERKRKDNAPALRTHCPKGHAYEGDNVIRGSNRPGAHRKCRICCNQRDRERYRLRNEKRADLG